MNKPLVSIIIPTFNRAHLISETLDSVLAQTYDNWECIVVDDGSTDDTDKILAAYCKKDARFQYHHRPKDRLKGGNAARNYGFKISKGEYVNFFDSDDLMLPNHLDIKVAILNEKKVDFVICGFNFFDTNKTVDTRYDFSEGEVNFISFTTTSISWYTPSVMLLREKALRINFNEILKSGQEFNYFGKLLLITKKLKIINEILVLIRDTPNSIGNNRKKEKSIYLKSRFNIYWVNYLEIYKQANSEKFNKHSLLICISCYFQLKRKLNLPNNFNKQLIRVFKWKVIYFYISIFTQLVSGKYYYFYNRMKN